jgi:hypothetical protein
VDRFEIYFVNRGRNTVQLIFSTPFHQEVLRDVYLIFMLCEKNMFKFWSYLQDNDNSLPPTGLPLSPESNTLRDHTGMRSER